jgi:hypothetical protein
MIRVLSIPKIRLSGAQKNLHNDTVLKNWKVKENVL